VEILKTSRDEFRLDENLSCMFSSVDKIVIPIDQPFTRLADNMMQIDIE